MHLLDVSLKRCVSKELGFREYLGWNMRLPGKLGCHILEVLLVTLTALRSRWVRCSWSPNSTVLHLDIYLCKYTNLKDTAGQSATLPPACNLGTFSLWKSVKINLGRGSPQFGSPPLHATQAIRTLMSTTTVYAVSVNDVGPEARVIVEPPPCLQMPTISTWESTLWHCVFVCTPLPT